jgi:hypothetical protein
MVTKDQERFWTWTTLFLIQTRIRDIKQCSMREAFDILYSSRLANFIQYESESRHINYCDSAMIAINNSDPMEYL